MVSELDGGFKPAGDVKAVPHKDMGDRQVLIQCQIDWQKETQAEGTRLERRGEITSHVVCTLHDANRDEGLISIHVRRPFGSHMRCEEQY